MSTRWEIQGDLSVCILYIMMQAIPFITLMIVVEAAINHFVRDKPQNLADR